MRKSQLKRNTLADIRPAKTEKLKNGVYLTLGFYDNKNQRPGEIFLNQPYGENNREVQHTLDAWAATLSLSLQYGVPIRELFGNKRCIDATRIFSEGQSTVDLVREYMINNYGNSNSKT
jgi:hypothetical protein